MKKNQFPFSAMFIAFLCSPALFSSCQQDEELLSSATPAEEIVIKMSIPSSSSVSSRSISDQNVSSSSASSNSDYQTIEQGDTVDVYDLKDVNIIVSAENDMGKGLDGTWVIYDIDTDRNAKDNTFVQNTPYNSEIGSITSMKLTFLGLYKAEFRMKTGATSFFYIRHTGIPGSVGDSWLNNYSFRLDKETYQVVNDAGHKGYTLYIAYNGNESTRLENIHAMIICGGNHSFTTKTGYVLSGMKEYNLQKCKYSPGYVRVSFLTDDAPDINGQYQVYFYLGDFAYDWMLFEACNMSDWLKYETITFQAI